MKIIKNIKIRNFRSIRECEIDLGDMNVFYGLNDAGKSNILKALNLFFNGKTDYDEEFDFESNFCLYDNTHKKKAKEIKIELTFSPPQHFRNKDEFIWSKTWRKEGLHEDRINDIIPTDGRAKWVKKIKYRYIPAIKDSAYLSYLLKELYHTLSISSTKNLKSVSNGILKQIKGITKDLSFDLQSNLGFNSEIDLPDDLSSLFSILDFKTFKDGKPFYLKNRGDGIKVRHIPSILKFIHENNDIRGKGNIKVDTIWGYEEPENNLEGFTQFKEAENLFKISEKLQCFITTHSPAFYLLGNKEEDNIKGTLFRAIQEENITKYKEITNENKDLFDDEFLSISPFIDEKIRELETRIKKIKEMKIDSNNIILVEGIIDKKVIESYFESIGKLDEVNIIDCGGTSQLKNSIKAIYYDFRYKNKNIIAIVDDDNAGREVCQEIKRFNEKISILKEIKTPNRVKIYKVESEKIKIIKNVLKGVFKPTIEHLYPVEVWEKAKEKGLLIEKDIENYIIDELNRDSKELMSLESKENLKKDIKDKLKEIPQENIIYITHEIKDVHYKKNFANIFLKEYQNKNKFNDIEKLLDRFIKNMNI